MFCGYREEACPVDAIRLGLEWQTAGLNGSPFTQDIQKSAYRPRVKDGVQSVLDDEERRKAGI